MVKCVTIGWRGDAGERADALKGTRVSVRENGWRRGDGMGAGFRTGFRTVVRIFRTRLTGSHTTVRLFFRTRASVRKKSHLTGFFDSSRAISSQAHSLVISADWNAYELTKGNDDAYGQTVRRRVVLEM